MCRETFAELVELEKMMFNFSIRADAHNTTDEFGEPREPNGEFVSFEDVCR